MNKKKNLSNRFQITFRLICFSGIILFLNSCNNDNSTIPDCGCESETILTVPSEEIAIPSEEQIRGFLFFKHPDDSDRFYDEDEYKNRFWIFRETMGCSMCETYFIVCNEDAIGAEYDYLKQQDVQDSVEVEFSGNIKQICNIKATPVIYAHGEIVLNSIKDK